MKLDDDDFSLFGLPQRFGLDRQALDARWRALQSEVHPDRFAADGAAAQRVAMQWSVRVNEAYQRLKHPLSRGAYLAQMRGAAIDAERNTAMPAEFLMQQMAWREALDEAHDVASVEALDLAIQQQHQERLAALAQALDERQDAPAAALEVRALMFIERFRDDINRRLERLEA